MVVICGEGRLMLYTLRELDGSPQCRVTYLLPKLLLYSVYYNIHATPSFHGTAARPDLVPGYVPSLESQIIVLEVFARSTVILVDDVHVVYTGGPLIFVIDAAIFSEKAMQSETPVEIPWSDWGPQYTGCFPHDRSHRISVFGSKMAYALPRDCTPEPGERVEELSDEPEDRFYVHIWDFNKRVIARAKNANDCKLLIRKPGPVAKSHFGKMISDLEYTATVCHTPFKGRDFEKLFLEEDRLTLIWVSFLIMV
jgi:hypothetical protein